MATAYVISNKNISIKNVGLLADEFLPFVTLNLDKFKADYENSEEPTSTEGIELSEGIKKSVIEDNDNRVYTITNDLEEIKIPFLVKKGTDDTFYDSDGRIKIAWADEVEGVSFKEDSFDTEIGQEIVVTINKTNPKLNQEVELYFLANDIDTFTDNEGELKDALCGRVKIKFEPEAIKYETLRIKVLDHETNDPVSKLHLESICIEGKYSITTKFNSTTYNRLLNEASSENLIKQSQEALDGLGFDTHTPGEKYYENGRNAYNSYWETRFPHLVELGLIEKVTDGDPPNEMLKYIVEEYNNNFSTDKEGVVKLKIPKSILDKSKCNILISLRSSYIKVGDDYKKEVELDIKKDEDLFTEFNGNNIENNVDNDLIIHVYALKRIFECLKYSSNYGPYYHGENELKDYDGWNALIAEDKITSEGKEILIAMSENEGNLDSMQSYDSEVMTVGAMQKTVNSSGEGEFAVQVKEFKETNSSKYQELFVNNGWSIEGNKMYFKSKLTTGQEKVTADELKTFIRTGFASDSHKMILGCEPLEHLLAAVNDKDFQAKQIEDFIYRLNNIVLPIKPNGYTYVLSQYLKSKLGKACVLDHHVNRPAHVKIYFAEALTQFFNKKDLEVAEINKGKTEAQQITNISRNPSEWGVNHSTYESELLDIYGPLRGQALGSISEARAMTDATNRYTKLKNKLK